MLECSAKVFEFDGRNCLQLCHFASKFTVILCDIRMEDRNYLAEMLMDYMLDVYADDKQTMKLVKKLFTEHPVFVFDKLTDKSIISSLNLLERYYLQYGDRLCDFIRDGVLRTRELNRDVNWYPVTIKVDGKKEFFEPKEKFAELIKKYYQ